MKESIPTENQSNSVWFIERFNKQDQQNLKKIEKQNNKNNNKYKEVDIAHLKLKAKEENYFYPAFYITGSGILTWSGGITEKAILVIQLRLWNHQN